MILQHCMITSVLQAVMHESFKDITIYPSAEVIPKVFWEPDNISLQKQRWEKSEEKSVKQGPEKRIFQ